MKNIEMVDYVNYIFPSPSSYKAFRGRYEFNDPNKVRWNGIPLPFLDNILDCGVDATFVTNKGIELDPDEFIHCDTSNLEDVFNAINSFKEAKQNNPDDLCFIKYASYTNHKPNNIRGGIYVYKNETYINLISDLPFDDDKYFITEAVKLDKHLSEFIRLIIKCFSTPIPYPIYIPKEDSSTMVKEALKEYGLDKSSSNSYDKDSNNLRELFSKIENPYLRVLDSKKDNPFSMDDNIPIKNHMDYIDALIYGAKAKKNLESKSISDDATSPITPEEIKDIGNSYDIDQVTKHMNMIKKDLDYKNKAIVSPISPEEYLNMLKKDLKDNFGEPKKESKKRFEALFDPSDRNKYLKKKFDRITDDIFFPVVPGGYIDLNGNDVEYEKSHSHKDWKYLVRFCRESETFIITASSGEETRTYAFLDENYHVLQKADINESYNKEEITAPKGSFYLVVNSKNTPLNVVKK